VVRRLVDSDLQAGRYSIVWNGTNEHGAQVASGVYVYVIKAGEFTAQRKLLLMK
jgi:flagellar hook assembly protein FlgD